jgi:hypothetical protein
MNKVALITASIAFMAGTAIGWIAKSSVEKDESSGRETPRTRARQKIANSETRVKTVTTVVTNTVNSAPTETANEKNTRQSGFNGFMADLERMKTEDPEKYSSMTNRIAQFRKNMIQRAESKLETLAAVDTAGWSKNQIATHEKYQELIARREELMEIVRLDSDATQQERTAAFAELRELGSEIRKASEKERNLLLDKTFRELGYNGSDAAEIRETVKTIYSTTEEWGGFGRHGRRGPGGRNR